MVEMIPVKSSNIAAIGYEDGKLHVEFKGRGDMKGATYVYENVPAHLWERFRSAAPMGPFFHTHIRGGGFAYSKTSRRHTR